jgi:hypothetical protein
MVQHFDAIVLVDKRPQPIPLTIAARQVKKLEPSIG